MAEVKICGLNDAAGLDAAVEAGARYVGFVFFPPSPRAVTPQEAAALAARVPPGVAKVGLFVDPDDATLTETLAVAPLDMIQLHKVDAPERLAALRALAGLPVAAARPVADAASLERAERRAAPADMLLLDAKPPEGGLLPGGNGLAFDWRVLTGRRIGKPWMLAGGLTPENVARAIALTGATRVDVSSGVESAPGRKDPERIRAFLRAARAA